MCSLYVLVLAIVCKQYLLISMNVNVWEGWVGLGGILCRIELCYCRSHRDLTVCWKQMHKKDSYSIKVHGLDHHNRLILNLAGKFMKYITSILFKSYLKSHFTKYDWHNKLILVSKYSEDDLKIQFWCFRSHTKD